ncbi:MAG TPA: SRPBCC family protein [Candidatus Krumholzibacteria bacterium]|nr:SRPBCC family protein [Candidatus Krumholzibacteria bacterium]
MVAFHQARLEWLTAMDMHVAVTVGCVAPPEDLFRHAVTDLETLPRGVRRCGPLPGVARAEILEGDALRTGVVRRVHLTDGSVLNEGIVEIAAPSSMSYRQLTPYRFPLSLLAKSARGRYTFTPTGSGTRMTWEATIQLTSPLAYPLMACVRGLFLRRMMTGFLECVRDDVVRAQSNRDGSTAS